MNPRFADLKPTLLVFCALLFTACGTTKAAEDPTAPPPFAVTVTGTGAPMLLIPGLASDGAVWDDVVAHYADRYACHVLTLPGFSDQPPTDAAPYLATMRDAIIDYIRTNDLGSVVLMGHSLGGFLSLWIASTAPDLVGRVVVMDAVPFLPALMMPNATAEMMEPSSAGMRDMMASQSQDAFRATQAQMLPTMISDSAWVAQTLATGGESHPPTVGQAMYEMMTTDLRDALARISAPTLVIGTWVGYQPYATQPQIEAAFDAQYEKLPNAEVTVHPTAKHFIMYDDLDGYLRTVDAFLNDAAG